ncbi:DUF484 family protein [Vibrio rumoiensis]|uniref:3',5'-cyclic-nucleotide phosphodiesterase n=1 Tax=Vibrio rumoiensis 1S-45 TaxID=1188252 RepID=A0A1E5E374_9VIBR|nr:DUF484 family protein [Vibrio rumoiensis]OEF26098.1 3',5'-cyclic-nucleotide phosphodiesterase [Vibrio rumoiensis 1S-45]
METTDLTAEIVADYLKDHPDFFADRRALLDHLSISHQQQGAVSLVEIQMRRQRQKIEELEEDITQLMSLAAKNDRTFHQLMNLQQRLLRCDSLVQIEAALEGYAHSIGLKAHLFLLVQDKSRNKHGSLEKNDEREMNQRKWALQHDTYQRFMTNHLNGKEAYLGRLNRQDRHALFGGDRFASDELSELGSYVILPLVRQSPLGLLAFSSQEGGHFQPEMDTLFLRHLTALVTFLVKDMPIDDEMMSEIKTLSCANGG